MTYLIILVIAAILLVVLSGGIIYYFKEGRKLAKEFKEFMEVTFEALKDKKITIAEKERMLKEFADMKPIAREIKTKFIDDAKDLADDVKEAYEIVKNKIKG